MHFLLAYRLATLLPLRELPLKTSAQRTLAYVDSLPMQMSRKISGITGLKFTVIFFIDGVNATIRVAIRPPVVE